MGFLRSLAVNDRVNTEYLRGLAQAVGKDATIALKVQRLQGEYSSITSGADKRLSDSFTYNGRPKILPMVALSIILFFVGLFIVIRHEMGIPSYWTPLLVGIGLLLAGAICSMMRGKSKTS